jgi:hypothetical protein
MLTVEGMLEIELQPRPLMLAGQFHLAAADPGRARVRIAPLVVSAVLVAPAAFGLIAGVLRAQAGVAAPFDLISGTPALSAIIAASLFVGAPLAVLMNLLPILRFSLQRQDGKLSTTVALKPNLLQLAVLVVAVGVAGVFFGHLVADELACLRGIKSAC